MALTKPAGVFMQLLAIPVVLLGIGLLGRGPTFVLGLLVIAAAGAMLYYGGRPAREAAAARRRASGDGD